MFPPRCYTCGSILSGIEIPYKRDMKELCEKYNATHDSLSRGLAIDKNFNEAKREILNRYTEKDKICCRTIIMTASNIIGIVR